MKQPFFSGIPFRLRMRIYFARHRKHVNENLGLIIALLAAAFAGWSGYEAHATRNDALAALKIAQRSYVDVQDHTVSFTGARMMRTGKTLLQYKHTVTVYGNSPAFEVEETSVCRLGVFADPRPGITFDDFQLLQSFDLPFLQRLPAEIIPGSRHSSSVTCNYPEGGANRKTNMGALVYGIINYVDIFGDKHQKHFCYLNMFLEPEAVDDTRGLAVDNTGKILQQSPGYPNHWRQDDVEAGKHLIACKIWNDEVSGEAANKINLKIPFIPQSDSPKSPTPVPSPK